MRSLFLPVVCIAVYQAKAGEKFIHSWPSKGQQDCWGHAHDTDGWLDTETDSRKVLSTLGGILCASSCLLTDGSFAKACAHPKAGCAGAARAR